MKRRSDSLPFAHTQLLVHVILLNRTQIPVVLVDSEDVVPKSGSLWHSRVATSHESILRVCEIWTRLVRALSLAPPTSMCLERHPTEFC